MLDVWCFFVLEVSLKPPKEHIHHISFPVLPEFLLKMPIFGRFWIKIYPLGCQTSKKNIRSSGLNTSMESQFQQNRFKRFCVRHGANKQKLISKLNWLHQATAEWYDMICKEGAKIRTKFWNWNDFMKDEVIYIVLIGLSYW